MKLNLEQINESLKELEGWEISERKIEKTFEFPDFKTAIAWVNQVADLAEKANHHPDIEIKYNKVEIELSTHSEGGVSQKDINLAAEIERINNDKS